MIINDLLECKKLKAANVTGVPHPAYLGPVGADGGSGTGGCRRSSCGGGTG